MKIETRAGWTILTVLVVVLAVTPAIRADEATNEERAIAVAKEWLALVDGGDFAGSWETAAELFRNAVPKEKWVGMAGGVRTPLGALVSREVRSTTAATTLPGAPDGEYVVIEFDAVFENKASAVETVTPMRDPDGAWRVSGYFIK